MKSQLLKVSVFSTCLAGVGLLQAQNVTVVPADPVPATAGGPDVEAAVDTSSWDAMVTPDRVEKLLIEAVKNSKLRPFQKIRANIVLKTNFAPKLKQQLVLNTTSKLLEEGKISNDSGELVALVDWDSILDFITKLLPLLLQLIDLFG